MIQHRAATGLQVAILMFAVVFLATPMERYLAPMIGLPPELERTTGRIFIFVPAALILLGIPALRRGCARELRVPIPGDRAWEVAIVSFALIFAAIAAFGATLLYHWVLGGEYALARRIGLEATAQYQWERALSWPGIVFQVFVASTLGPVIEELVFRGFLYRAWEKQWGWIPSMLATSAVFAMYHPNVASAFLGSMVFVCLLRRTGSLRACILAHATYNTLLWYPLLGQFIFRAGDRQAGELGPWALHLWTLAAILVAVPLYAWMAREERAAHNRFGGSPASANA